MFHMLFSSFNMLLRIYFKGVLSELVWSYVSFAAFICSLYNFNRMLILFPVLAFFAFPHFPPSFSSFISPHFPSLIPSLPPNCENYFASAAWRSHMAPWSHTHLICFDIPHSSYACIVIKTENQIYDSRFLMVT